MVVYSKIIDLKFQICSFSHVRRRGNMIDHSLARRTVSSADCDVWVEKLPAELENVF